MRASLDYTNVMSVRGVSTPCASKIAAEEGFAFRDSFRCLVIFKPAFRNQNFRLIHGPLASCRSHVHTAHPVHLGGSGGLLRA